MYSYMHLYTYAYTYIRTVNDGVNWITKVCICVLYMYSCIHVYKYVYTCRESCCRLDHQGICVCVYMYSCTIMYTYIRAVDDAVE